MQFNSYNFNVGYFIIFVISTFMMTVTGYFYMISSWLAFWWVSIYYETYSKDISIIIFYLCLYFFYPTTVTKFQELYSYTIMFTLFTVVFAAFYWHDLFWYWKTSKYAKLILSSWVIWGIICITPVLYINYIDTELAPELLRKTSGLKTILPVLFSPFLLFLPLIALKNENDLRIFIRVLLAFIFINLVLTFYRYIFYVDFFPQTYTYIRQDGFRLTSFNVLDANATPRQYFFPFFLIVAIISYSKFKLIDLKVFILILIVIAIILSFSRTGYITGTITLLYLLILLRSNKKFLFYFGILGLTVFATLYYLDIFSYFYYGSDRGSLGNLVLRLDLYKVILEAIKSNPFFGGFPGGYEATVLRFGFQDALKLAEVQMSAHNTYLAVAVEWGIPMAFILILTLIITQIIGFKNNKVIKKYFPNCIELKVINLTAMALAFNYLIHSLTEIVPLFYIFFTCGLSLAVHNIIQNKIYFNLSK